MQEWNNMRVISPNHEKLQYCGRIDDSNAESYCFVYPYSSVRMKVKATKIGLLIQNRNRYWDNYIGYVIDGKQGRVQLENDDEQHYVSIAENLRDEVHDVFIFKRQDGCHYFCLQGVLLNEEAQLFEPAPLPERRIEVYGDSVSAGEVSEAVDYAGKEDPEHNGEYSNSYYSYAAITARKLHARLHDVAQGGIALLPKTGWFEAPDYIGMEQIYDKVQYNPHLGPCKQWDFKRYEPQLVLVALAQNDNHPEDYMKADYNCEKAQHWRARYEAFVRRLRAIYPNAFIVLLTTILEHDPAWDRSIDEVCNRLQDDRVKHFLYSNNGSGTKGHVRIPEAEKMAEELYQYLSVYEKEIFK